MLDLPSSYAGATFAELSGRAPAPEFLQRLEQSRRANIAMAQRRLLDRETYKGLRQYIRAPRDLTEAARNARWRDLHDLLRGSANRTERLGYYRLLRQPETVKALAASGCLL